MHGIYKTFSKPFDRQIGGGVNETVDPSVWLKWYGQSVYRPQPVEVAMQADLIDLGSSRVA
jgi:hypothetical protein